ncbi:MAG TPA: cytochrome c biogenesis protein CcsA [Longimicrobium sp.]
MSTVVEQPRGSDPHAGAAPPPRAVASPRWISMLGWLALLAFVGAQAFGFTHAPDRDMGHLQKIMYVHVPVAWNFLIAFLMVFVASILYLWKRRESYDLFAASAAEVGVVFTALTLCLGSLWGRPTWGVWWTWDPRLTSTAITLLLYAGYLALRAFTDDAERRARWSAAVGILAFLNVPIVYMSVRWWRTLHQPQSSPATVDTAYAWGLRLNAIAVLMILIYFVNRRYQAARMERAAEARREEIALTERGAHV